MFSSALQIKTMKSIKELFTKNVSVLSLMMFYHNRYTVVCKVIESVIYSFIDSFIFLIMCVCYKKSYLLTTKSLKTKFNDLLGWVFLKFWLISFHVMVFQYWRYKKWFLYAAVLLCRIICQSDFNCWKIRSWFWKYIRVSSH